MFSPLHRDDDARHEVLTQFKRGDYLDIVVDSSVKKGMTYGFYHGRSDVVFNERPDLSRRVDIRSPQILERQIPATGWQEIQQMSPERQSATNVLRAKQ